MDYVVDCLVQTDHDIHEPQNKTDAQTDLDYHVGDCEANGFVVIRQQFVMHHPDGRVAVVTMEQA